MINKPIVPIHLSYQRNRYTYTYQRHSRWLDAANKQEFSSCIIFCVPLSKSANSAEILQMHPIQNNDLLQMSHSLSRALTHLIQVLNIISPHNKTQSKINTRQQEIQKVNKNRCEVPNIEKPNSDIGYPLFVAAQFPSLRSACLWAQSGPLSTCKQAPEHSTRHILFP